MPRALLSVSDKTGLLEFAQGLSALGWEILSTGGTARTLRDAGIAVTDVSAVTGHPEMMDGRVKTLHPAVHAGLLARRDRDDDIAALAEQGYATIDVAVVNLYPFHEAAAANAELPVAMEKVDIGGPSMLRSAAKNHASVYVVVDPADYAPVLDAIRSGTNDSTLRRELARKVFEHTARYDKAIADYFAQQVAEHAERAEAAFPERLCLDFVRSQSLRYGENPDQAAAFYAEPDAPRGSLPGMRQLQGKELSFNNLLDADGAIAVVSAWADSDLASCAIIKHTTPCGVAVATDALTAYRKALACDPVSAFGGIIAFNRAIDAGTAEEVAKLFVEIVIAPGFDADALELLSKKKNLRVLELPIAAPTSDELDYKRVRGGLLVQQRLSTTFDESMWQVATRRNPTEQEWEDLRFAWRACVFVKSNAIVLARNGATIGIGAGQMSRVDSSRIATMKAADQNADTHGAALASDAYFPFRDGIDAAAAAGVRAVIQPGGSVRDAEVIAAADEHDMAMVFTGRRVFRH